MKPARCSRPPMEHVYAAEADDRDRSFCGNLEIFFRLVGKTIFFGLGENSYKLLSYNWALEVNACFLPFPVPTSRAGQ